MADFEILIKTEGSNQSAQDFDKVAKATDKVTDSTKKASEATEQHHGSTRKLFQGIKELGREVPILGTAFHLLHNPLVAISIISVGLIKIVKDVNAAYKEVADGIEESAKTVGQSGAKFRDAAAATEELTRAQETSKKAADDSTDAFKLQNEQLDLQFKLDSDLLEAQKQLALAKASTPEEKAAAEDRFGKATLALDLRHSKDKQAVIDKAIAEERARQFEAKAQLPDEEALNASLEKARLASQEADAAKRENREAFLDVEAFKAVSGTAPALPGQWQRSLDLELRHGSTAGAIAASKERLEKSKLGLAAAQQAQRNAFAELPPGVGDQAGLDAFIESKTGAVNADINRSGRRISDLQRQGQNEFLTGRGRAQVGDVQQQARVAQGITDNQKAQVEASRQLLNELNAGHHATLGLMQDIIKESATYRREIERLKNQKQNEK